MKGGFHAFQKCSIFRFLNFVKILWRFGIETMEQFMEPPNLCTSLNLLLSDFENI